jgi:hypothetical protein
VVDGAGGVADGGVDVPPVVVVHQGEVAALGAEDLGELADVELAGVGAGGGADPEPVAAADGQVRRQVAGDGLGDAAAGGAAAVGEGLRPVLAGSLSRADKPRRTVGAMGDSDPVDDAHPTLAQEAGTAISGDVLRLAYMTGAQIVHRPPWPGASFTEEQPEPGAGIRAALALGRAARAGVRVYIQRGREAGMTWEQVGEALGVAELARARGSSLAETAFEYAAERQSLPQLQRVAPGGRERGREPAAGMRVIVYGRLRQRSCETREGEKWTVYGVEVDDVGPSLRNASAKSPSPAGTSRPLSPHLPARVMTRGRVNPPPP